MPTSEWSQQHNSENDGDARKEKGRLDCWGLESGEKIL